MADRTGDITHQMQYETERTPRLPTATRDYMCTYELAQSKPIKRAARKPALIGGAVGVTAATPLLYPFLVRANNAAQIFAVCACFVAIVAWAYMTSGAVARRKKARVAIKLLNKMCDGQLAQEDIEYLNRFIDENSIGDAAVTQPNYFDAVLQGRATDLNHELQRGIVSKYVWENADDWWNENLLPYARVKRVFGNKSPELIRREDSLQRDYNSLAADEKRLIQSAVDEYHR